MKHSRQGGGEHRVHFLWLKLLAGRVICSSWAGVAIAWAFRDRIPFHGKRIAVSGVVPPRNKAALFWGTYESAEYRLIRDHLAADLPVIEAGAGVGAISSVIAGILGPGQALACVEGNPNVLPMLRRNLAEHASHLQCEVIEAAVGGDTEVVEFGIADNNLCSATVVRPEGGRRTIAVRCTTVSAVLARLEWSGPYQLVADIEGAEASLLVDDSRALTTCRRMIIELHGTSHRGIDYSAADLHGMIEAMGFVAVARYGAVRVFERNAGTR